MNQKKAATIFTAIIFIAALFILRMHFDKPTESETIIKQSYYIANIQTPQKKVENSNFAMNVTATQGNELYIEITNNSGADIQLDERARLYIVKTDGTRVKVQEDPIRVYVTRGTGRYEIVKKIPKGVTREVVFDCSELGKLSPGAYVINVYGQHIFFELAPNPALQS